MLKLDLDRVRDNVQRATTDDLLDRVTLYRKGMEPEAIEIIEAELRARGVTAAQQVDYEASRSDVLRDADGVALRCGRCGAPAVTQVRTWHRLWGLLPLFPRWLPLCAEHAAASGGRQSLQDTQQPSDTPRSAGGEGIRTPSGVQGPPDGHLPASS
jgi:hypothetical protein